MEMGRTICFLLHRGWGSNYVLGVSRGMHVAEGDGMDEKGADGIRVLSLCLCVNFW